MIPTEPLPLHHSWPIWHATAQLDLGLTHDADGDVPVAPHGGWACDLADDRLHWSDEVRCLFGFDGDDGVVTRRMSVALYDEPSRAAMERLRAHAIRHRRGFTLDVRIVPVRRSPRWLRLVAAPVCDDKCVVRLHGSKTDVSHLYSRLRG